jgi:hypothetical protein
MYIIAKFFKLFTRVTNTLGTWKWSTDNETCSPIVSTINTLILY